MTTAERRAKREQPRQEAGDIYRTARRRMGWQAEEFDKVNAGDMLTIEHIVRAMLEVLTPEQRAQILAKVKQ